MERSIQNKQNHSLPLADMEELSSALEKFHYENESSIHLDKESSRLSESSIEISIIDSDSSKNTEMDTFTEAETEPPAKLSEDSGVCDVSLGSEMLLVLEQKIDKLNDLFIEQSELLAALKNEIQYSNQTLEKVATDHGRMASDLINLALAQRLKGLQIDTSAESDAAGLQATQVNSRAKALLDALEYKHKASSIDAIIRTALTEFLQSDELKDHMVAATMGSIQQLVQDCLYKDVCSSYLPLLERSHRRLLKQISSTLDDAFREMEANAASFSRSSYKSTRSMRLALERHQRLLEESATTTGDIMTILKNSVHDVLQKELVEQWRGKMLNVLAEQQSSRETSSSTSSFEYIPSSPPQPAEPGRSAIDQLMKAAEINVQMNEGDVNGSFEKALMASELPLVMAACRAADPAVVFAAPCQLKQHVLLSLVQQLATDMVHDTQLKCRYMEDAIMNLDTGNPVTRQHLPIVVEELCNHLSSFLSTFPGHMSSRKIKMLIMAASSLCQKASDEKPIFPQNLGF